MNKLSIAYHRLIVLLRIGMLYEDARREAALEYNVDPGALDQMFLAVTERATV